MRMRDLPGGVLHATKAGGQTADIHWRDRPFLSTKATAVLLGTSVSQVYKLVKDEQLVFVKLAGKTLVRTDSLIALIGAAADYSPSDRAKRAVEKRKEIARAAHEAA
jgi:hypothetical protein